MCEERTPINLKQTKQILETCQGSALLFIETDDGLETVNTFGSIFVFQRKGNPRRVFQLANANSCYNDTVDVTAAELLKFIKEYNSEDDIEVVFTDTYNPIARVYYITKRYDSELKESVIFGRS